MSGQLTKFIRLLDSVTTWQLHPTPSTKVKPCPVFTRQFHKKMKERVDSSPWQVVPPISAIFLVVFDQKSGYSIAYKRAVPGLQLEGVVEYKSLPSGLHNVQSDLVYFIHEQHAGVSSFAQGKAGEADRNAHFAAVGVLVPLSYGRLGRSWLHAEALRGLAQNVLGDIHDTKKLDEYWDTHKIDGEEAQQQTKDGADGETGSPKQGKTRRRKTRAPSDATALGNDSYTLSPDHPALSIPNHLDMFGPLLFPLYRAALLRKRILIVTNAPVREACNLVYNVSVLSNIPSQVADLVKDTDTPSPIRPLFNVGVHDIPYLSSLSDGESFIACSTDEILATKKNLYDVLVELPQKGKESGADGWPKMRTAAGDQVKATQRDLRRYRALKRSLQRIERSAQEHYRDEDEEDEAPDNEDDSDTAPLARSTRSIWDDEDDVVSLDGEGDLVEPTTWTAMAYTGFLWWASAGEQGSQLEEESSQDGSLLEDLPLPDPRRRDSSGPDSGSAGERDAPSAASESDKSKEEAQAIAMVLIAFAHRLTVMTLESMADMVETADNESDDTDAATAGQRAISIDSEDVRRMGLDVWSEADRKFAQELFARYFARETEIRGQAIECCGIKIC